MSGSQERKWAGVAAALGLRQATGCWAILTGPKRRIGSSRSCSTPRRRSRSGGGVRAGGLPTPIRAWRTSSWEALREVEQRVE